MSGFPVHSPMKTYSTPHCNIHTIQYVIYSACSFLIEPLRMSMLWMETPGRGLENVYNYLNASIYRQRIWPVVAIP